MKCGKSNKAQDREAERKLFEEMEQHNSNSDEDPFDDFDVCNAPKTRKANSDTTLDGKSPFGGFDIVPSFDDAVEVAKPKPMMTFETPTRASQLEKDLRDMKGDLISQRGYICNIDPDMLKSIFKSSIEIENILQIVQIFTSGGNKWIKSEHEYLIGFLHALTKVDRFSMAVDF